MRDKFTRNVAPQRKCSLLSVKSFPVASNFLRFTTYSYIPNQAVERVPHFELKGSFSAPSSEARLFLISRYPNIEAKKSCN